MSRSIPRAPALTALALAVALTTACAPTVESAPTVEPTPTVEPAPEPAPVVADEPTPEPDETTPAPEPTLEQEVDLVPVPVDAVEQAREVGRGGSRQDLRAADEQTEMLQEIAAEVESETGRRIVYVYDSGQYGWEGELIDRYITFTSFWPELQTPCQDLREKSRTIDDAVTLARACIARTPRPEVYEIVVVAD